MPVPLGGEPGDKFRFATRINGIGAKTDRLDPLRRARTTHLGIASERNHNNRGIPGCRQLDRRFHSPLPGITAEGNDCVDARRSITRGPHKQPGGRNQEDDDDQENGEDSAFKSFRRRMHSTSAPHGGNVAEAAFDQFSRCSNRSKDSRFDPRPGRNESPRQPATQRRVPTRGRPRPRESTDHAVRILDNETIRSVRVVSAGSRRRRGPAAVTQDAGSGHSLVEGHLTRRVGGVTRIGGHDRMHAGA